MNVGFLVGTLGRGGAERQLIYMLRALKSEGVNLRVLCLTRGEALEREIADLQVPVEWVGPSPSRLKRARLIIKVFQKYKLDIIQSSHFYTNLYVSLAGRMLGVKHIGAVRSDLHSEIAADRIFGRWQFRMPQHLIVNSELALNRAFAKGLKHDKIDMVRNIVDLPDDSQTEAPACDNNKRLKIVFVGRLNRQKRPEQFVRMASQLRRDLPGVKVTYQIAGDGPLRPDIEKLIAEYDLKHDEMSLLGELSDMKEVYREADILVLTSSCEGTPNVILEAMSYGVPIVATRVGGVPEIVSERAGVLVDPSDFRGLVEATSKLILNPNLRRTLGRAGREYVAAHHSLPYLQKRLLEIYHKLLAHAE